MIFISSSESFIVQGRLGYSDNTEFIAGRGRRIPVGVGKAGLGRAGPFTPEVVLMYPDACVNFMWSFARPEPRFCRLSPFMPAATSWQLLAWKTDWRN